MPSSLRTRPAVTQQEEQILNADGAVGVEVPQTNAIQEQNPHRAAVRAPVVILECPHGQVAHAVAIQITQEGYQAEVIEIIQSAGEAAFGVADLLVREHPAGLSVGALSAHDHGKRDYRNDD